MKLSKAEIAAIIITVIFIALTVVYTQSSFGKDANITISEQHPEETETAVSNITKSPESSVQALININTATAEELCELPRIGEKIAARIIAYREENGPFKTADEIMNVSGIGAKTYEKIKSYITID